jgi:hypothetical protein
MYTVCTYRLAEAMGMNFLYWIPRIFLYIALAAWLATFLGLLHALVAIGLRSRAGLRSNSS